MSGRTETKEPTNSRLLRFGASFYAADAASPSPRKDWESTHARAAALSPRALWSQAATTDTVKAPPKGTQPRREQRWLPLKTADPRSPPQAFCLLLLQQAEGAA